MVVQNLEGMSTSLNTVASNLVDVFHGAMSIGDAFKNLGQVVQQFFADFLLKIAQAHSAADAAERDSGRRLGRRVQYGDGNRRRVQCGRLGAGQALRRDRGRRSNRTRDVSPNWFANAPRFHDGGLPGLKRDEVPTILQKGEQVLSKDDPNNILNGAGQQSSGPAQPVVVRVVNTFDASDVVSQGLGTAAGESGGNHPTWFGLTAPPSRTY